MCGRGAIGKESVEQFARRAPGAAKRLNKLFRESSPWTRPLQVGIARGIGEGLLGGLVLSMLGVLIEQPFPVVQGVLRLLAALCYALALLWLAVWPAWRIRLPRIRRWYWRGAMAGSRVLIYGVLLALSAAAITAVVRVLPGNPNVRAFLTGQIPLVLFTFYTLRILLVTGARIRQWAGRRLRRQLTLSHLVVVVITMISLVSLGGAGVMAVLIGFLPVPANQASVLADAVRPTAGQTLNRTQVQITLNALLNGGLRPGAINSAPLLAVIPWSVINRRALVANTHGVVVGATRSADFTINCPYLAAGARLPTSIWNHFLQEALAGRSAEAMVPSRLLCGARTEDQRYAEAPIRDATGRPIGMAVVQGGRFLPTTRQLVGVLVVGVTAATLALLIVAVIPTFAISTGVSYVFARGITRRLVAVSRAATALADGDLSQRAPLTARNEIGRLAEDFNRMADHMEATMTELRQARAQAESALRAREELVAGVSHELRTPIAVVRAHLESLHMRAGAEAGRPIPVSEDTLEALRHEMERLTDMVDDLFSLARAGAGALPLRVEPIDVASLVREQGELLRPLVRQHGAITLSVEVGPGLPPALADGDRLRQILANLVRNAARHTPEGGIIALAAGVEDRWVVITVADTGEGIAPEHLPRIFEPFYRADPARSRAAGGAGLGLSIVSEFVQLMGGHVAAESTLGEGSSFRVYLPRATRPAGTADTAD